MIGSFTVDDILMANGMTPQQIKKQRVGDKKEQTRREKAGAEYCHYCDMYRPCLEDTGGWGIGRK